VFLHKNNKINHSFTSIPNIQILTAWI